MSFTRDLSFSNVGFQSKTQYVYDLELNVTAGVLGMNSQVSASVLRAVVGIYSKDGREHVMKVCNTTK